MRQALEGLCHTGRPPPPAGLGRHRAVYNPPCPPRGLNSWDSFLLWVTESNVTLSANAMATQGLVSLGWRYYVMDMGWYVPTDAYNTTTQSVDPMKFATDGQSRYMPDPLRFPSSAATGSLAPLCRSLVERYNVLCGVHLVAGVGLRAVVERQPIFNTTWTASDIAGTIASGGTRWNLLLKRGPSPSGHGAPVLHPGAQAYYNSVVERLGGWGVRFIKLDWAWQPDGLEVLAMRQAIARSGRDIVLSVNGICQDPTWPYCVNYNASTASNRSGYDYAQMWRIGGDLWDNWDQVAGTIPNRAHYHAERFNFPDNDMLPFGPLVGTGQGGDGNPHAVHKLRPSNLSVVEAQTIMTFWSIAQSPLMYGGFLPASSKDIIHLLTQPDILEINAHGIGSRQVWGNATSAVWRAALPHTHVTHALVSASNRTRGGAGSNRKSHQTLVERTRGPRTAPTPALAKTDTVWYAAVFNLANSTQTIRVPVTAIVNATSVTHCRCRRVWASTKQRASVHTSTHGASDDCQTIVETLPAHGSEMVAIEGCL
eukprot:m.218567 g.218567  ORF g.218567 m.218567 type:complete len:539 (-) comp29758_c0_seq1:139-1755(-)